MRRIILGVLVILLSLLIVRCWDAIETSTQTTDAHAPTVILVSIDGFRWDYFERGMTPTIQRLADEGVRSEGLIPAFPSKTFPNHYTAVTGLYPSEHGVVGNTMYDPVFDATFTMGNRAEVQNARWWGGEPIWVTAEKQGQRSAPFFWPGSEAPIQNMHGSFWMPYDNDLSGTKRVDQVLQWLDLPADERPTFLTLYFSDVDAAGHEVGPETEAVDEALRTVDAHLQRLVEGLEKRGLYDTVNLLLTADHGMTAIAPERVVFLDDYIDMDDVQVVDYSPVALLRPHEGKEDAVYAQLRRAEHLSVYRKGDVPGHLHFNDHRRIPPIIGIADLGWSITTRDHYERNRHRFAGGTHGYDPLERDMHGLFVAHGPSFRKGVTVGPFQNVHLYNLMAAILELEPAPNSGDPAAIAPLLVAAPPTEQPAR